MHTVYKSPLAILTLVLMMQSVQAQTVKQPEPSGKPAFVLINKMTAFREQYLSKLMQVIRASAGADLVLEEHDITLKTKFAAATLRANAVRRLLSYDLNNDGEVTAAEVKLKLSQSYGGNYRKRKLIDKQLFKSDFNNDGKVTIAEVLKSATQNKNQQSRVSRQIDIPRQLLALDPNGDKRLTLKELEHLGRTAFAVFDRDGDGTLNAEENKKLMEARRKIRFGYARRKSPRRPSRRRVENCNLPKAGKNDELIILSSYGSGRLSNVTVTGQNKVTETTNFAIEPGTTPLYIIATSHTPMIWNFTGSTERVARFVAISQRQSDKKPSTGVIGLTSDKVTFPAAGACMAYFSRPASGTARMAKSIVEAELKHPVRRMISRYELSSVNLPSGKMKPRTKKPFGGLSILLGDGDDAIIIGGKNRKHFTKKLKQDLENKRRNAKPLPAGVDRRTYRALYRFSPGGVAKLNVTKVISPGVAEEYDVIPQEGGLVQLMKEGKMERLSDGMYLIKKPIPRFPAGLGGAHRVKFLLGKGVPMPKGDPGHSCIMSEETGQPAGKARQRRQCR